MRGYPSECGLAGWCVSEQKSDQYGHGGIRQEVRHPSANDFRAIPKVPFSPPCSDAASDIIRTVGTYALEKLGIVFLFFRNWDLLLGVDFDRGFAVFEYLKGQGFFSIYLLQGGCLDT
ncbi:hypothetical protein CDAR_281201 [Caerostris darwini]|uniref:Uncharacterized protein n=1 Tax=Caerostris darwini TaxID=1538125 RepID=A0AAV4WVP1_9ARAC|nr:hypothetical protein CDAR_281201 [Caerostris darwini]